MLNEKIPTAQSQLLLRTSFVFLPEDGYCFINKITRGGIVDFYNVDNWIKYRLSPCVGEPLLALPKSSALSALLSLPDLSLRNRSNSHSKNVNGSDHISNSFAEDSAPGHRGALLQRPHHRTAYAARRVMAPGSPIFSPTSRVLPGQERHLSYLTRTLAETKRFRAELGAQSRTPIGQRIPPLAINGKDIPTTAGAKVSSRGSRLRRLKPTMSSSSAAEMEWCWPKRRCYPWATSW